MIKLIELLGFSLGLLIITFCLIYRLNPEYCARCDTQACFPQYREIIDSAKKCRLKIPYCIKCYLYINLSEWKCNKCHASGTHRIHELGFLHRFLVIRGKRIVPKTCMCGNIVELTQR